jgi:site-specific recombinase XerD
MLLISELVTEYLSDKVLRNNSEESYQVAARAWIRWGGDCLVEEVNRKAILQWRREVLTVTLKAVSWNTYIRHLHGLVQFGIERGIVGLVDNPFEDCKVRTPKRPKKTVDRINVVRARHVLTDMEKEEVEWQRQAKIHPAWFWRAVYETFVYTGLRANEVINLRRCDVDIHKGLICVTADISKNYEERYIPIHKELKSYLIKLIRCAVKMHVDANDQLFNVNIFSMRHRKKRMDMDQVGAFYTHLSNSIDVRVSPHRFRHTIATELMRNPDRDIHVVKELLGHRNIATTLSYISVNHDQMRELLNTYG